MQRSLKDRASLETRTGSAVSRLGRVVTPVALGERSLLEAQDLIHSQGTEDPPDPVWYGHGFVTEGQDPRAHQVHRAASMHEPAPARGDDVPDPIAFAPVRQSYHESVPVPEGVDGRLVDTSGTAAHVKHDAEMGEALRDGPERRVGEAAIETRQPSRERHGSKGTGQAGPACENVAFEQELDAPDQRRAKGGMAMARVIVGMTMSLDGFVADQSGSVERLYPDLAALRGTAYMNVLIEETGAVLMGRRTFEMGDPDSYVGNYEFQVPIFVLTHHPPQITPKQDENLTFTFVTDGVESAIGQASAVAGDRAVQVVGGVNVTRQLLDAGLVDELRVDIMPVLLGGGLRFFEDIDSQRLLLEKIGVQEVGMRTSLSFRVEKT